MQALKHFEDTVLMLLGNSDSMVLDLNAHRIAPPEGSDFYYRCLSWLGELHSVVYQIRDYLSDNRSVTLDLQIRLYGN